VYKEARVAEGKGVLILPAAESASRDAKTWDLARSVFSAAAYFASGKNRVPAGLGAPVLCKARVVTTTTM